MKLVIDLNKVYNVFRDINKSYNEEKERRFHYGNRNCISRNYRRFYRLQMR